MNLLLTTHGKFADGILDACAMFFGESSQVNSVGLTTSIDEYKGDLRVIVEQLIEDDQLLIMTDLQGGTPFNESLALMLENPEKVRVVSGVNLPMLLEVCNAKDLVRNVDDLANLAKQVGVMGVYKQDVSNDDDQEDDLF